MYSHKVIARNLSRASALLRERYNLAPSWKLTYPTDEEWQQMVSHFDSLLDDKGVPTRKLSEAEALWVLCESTLCKLDFHYFCKRYVKIEDWSGRIVGFKPNRAQQVVLRKMAELEDRGLALMMMFLKARQLGITTLFQAILSHRVFLYRNVNAPTGSAEPDKSRKMVKKLEFIHQQLPWWLRPRRTAYRAGELIEYGDINSSIDVSWGNQTQGIGRGSTSTVCHLSELASFLNPEELVDAALIRTMHENPFSLLALESTAEGIGNWWHRTWEWNVKMAASGMARLEPIFLPWFMGTELYPTAGWLKRRPVPANWQVPDYVQRHAEAARTYVMQTPMLLVELGGDWEMPIEQKWFYHVEYQEAKEKKTLHIFLQEMPACVAGDMKICTGTGIMPIRNAHGIYSTDTGDVTRWISKGEKQTYWIETKLGRKLRVTGDHLIALKDGEWKEALNLKFGDTIKLSQPKFSLSIPKAKVQITKVSSRETKLTEDLAKLLGYFMGDGCFSSGDCLEIACDAKDKDIIEDVCRTIENVVGVAPKLQDRGGMVLVRSSNVLWKPLLQDLGCIQRRGEESWKRKVCVPNIIWSAPRKFVTMFLSALFECDGHQYPSASRIHFFSSKEDFARDIQLLLLGYGINAPLKIADKRAGDGHKYIGRELQLGASNARIFNRDIGFLSERKRNTGALPKQKRSFADPELVDEVLSITEAGVTDVYDITVPGPDSFGAEGILVHNCPQEAFQNSNPTVFDIETLTEVRTRTGAAVPLGTYQLAGPSVSTVYHFWSPKKGEKPVHLRCVNPAGKVQETFRLVPVEVDGWPDNDPDGKIRIWEWPIAGETYAVGCDPSEGVDQDSSVVTVIKKATPDHPDVQVAEFACSKILPDDLWMWVFALCHLYTVRKPSGGWNFPKAIIEVNISAGDKIQTEMRKRQWPNFHQRFDPTRIASSKARSAAYQDRIGWKTDRANRPKIISAVRKAIRDGLLEVKSPELAMELATLEWNLDKKRIEAANGQHDDRVFALGIILASWYDPEVYGSVPNAWTAQREWERELEVRPPYMGGTVIGQAARPVVPISKKADARSLYDNVIVRGG